MKPSELAAFLERLVRHRLKLSTMIWGPPGIGKSSIVAQTAAARRLRFIDGRQLHGARWLVHLGGRQSQ